jgi:hypothetical protein
MPLFLILSTAKLAIYLKYRDGLTNLFILIIIKRFVNELKTLLNQRQTKIFKLTIVQ